MAMDLSSIKSVVGIKSGTSIKKIQRKSDGKELWSAGAIVTYMVDVGTSYIEEVDNGASCLLPTSFTPDKSGWKFVGWRENNTASGSVLTNKVMSDSPITLYAVFEQSVTVTYYNGGTTASTTTGKRYYNNANIVNPSFTLTQTAKSGWTARGWSTGKTGNAPISYNNGTAFTRDSNVTLYGLYQVDCNLYTVSNGSTETNAGTRYYNSYGTYVNPTFTVADPTRSGFTFKGWSASSSSTTAAYTSISKLSITTNTTLYAIWSAANITGTVSFAYDQTRNFVNTETLATILSSVDTSKYSGITLTLSQVSVSANFRGTQLDVYISDGTNKTRIGYAYQDWQTPSVEASNQGIVLKPTLTFSSSSGNKAVYLTSECHGYGQTTSSSSTGTVAIKGASYTLIGRTVIY